MSVLAPSEIVGILKSYKFPVHAESETQRVMHAVLELRGVQFTREHVLGPKDRVDFFIQGEFALEVKVSGSAKQIFKQCERYCVHENVKALILATNRPMGLPAFINGKPCFYLQLGSAWL